MARAPPVLDLIMDYHLDTSLRMDVRKWRESNGRLLTVNDAMDWDLIKLLISVFDETSMEQGDVLMN